MAGLSLPRPSLRTAFCALLLVLPLLTAWNLLAAAIKPALHVRIGPKLAGVTREAPVQWSWAALADGSLQKALAIRVTEAMPIRPLLIRINNELRFQMFGVLTAPQLVQGENGQLIERSYLEDYCGRTEGQGARLAADILPKLRDIQSYTRARGNVFLYLVTPSKAAHMPEDFVGRFPCPSTPAARNQLVQQYVAALRQGGIDVVDAANLTHGLKGRYDVPLFPQGGVHWNDLGSAEAVTAIVAEINRQAGRILVPPFTFSYKVSGVASGVDRDLVDLLNVFFPPLTYKTPKVTYHPSESCSASPARTIDAAIVGSSFNHSLGPILIEHNCLSQLSVYFYLWLSRSGETPYRALQSDLKEADVVRLRNAQILILEENESFAGRAGYVDDLRRIVTAR